MYSTTARLIVVMALGYFSANLIEWSIWLLAKAGANPYHISVAFRTIGVICAYVVLRDYAKGVFERGWRSLFELV